MGARRTPTPPPGTGTTERTQLPCEKAAEEQDTGIPVRAGDSRWWRL